MDEKNKYIGGPEGFGAMMQTLDTVSEMIQKDEPTLTEDQNTLRVIYVQLYALSEFLIRFGMTGLPLPNEMLYGIAQGIVETVHWVGTKESISTGAEKLERIANGEEV